MSKTAAVKPGKKTWFPPKRGQGLVRLNAVLNAMLIRELMDGPCTAKELQQVTGIGVRTVAMYLMALQRKGCIRVAAWERDASNKQSIRVYEFGEGPDAKKEPKQRAGAIQRAAQERKRLKLVERTPLEQAWRAQA